jgi:adenylate cyclase class 2
MYTEIEIKLPIPDVDRARQKLNEINARIKQDRHFEDNSVMDTPDEKIRQSGCLFRVRIVKPVDDETCRRAPAILTFKGQTIIKDGLKNREEIECTIDPPENFIRVLERLGYVLKFRYQKYRTVYGFNEKQIHICIDELPIGNFFELEGPPDEIHDVAEKLGYTREDYITDSYGALYYQWVESKGHEPLHMVFE